MHKQGSKIYAKKILAQEAPSTKVINPADAWSEFEPTFKDLLPEQKVQGPSARGVELQKAQRDIVDEIGLAADAIADAHIDDALHRLKGIKGKVYHFLNAVRESKIAPEKVEDVKELINNMIQGIDVIEDIIMPGLEAYRKTGEGDIEDLWQRVMKLTVLFIGVQAVSIVSKIKP